MSISYDVRSPLDDELDGSSIQHVVPNPPLVGREKILNDIDSALDAPEHAGVVLAGGVGVGKSRLLQEIVAKSRARGIRVLSMQPSIAFQHTALHAVSTALTAAGMKTPHTLTEAADELASAQQRRPLLLCVDNAHLLDGPSAALLLHLARERICSVAVVTGDGIPAPAEVAALWKDGWLSRINIEPMAEEEVARVCDVMLAEPLAPVSAARFAMLVGGNLVALRELLSCALEEGVLVRRGGAWADGDDFFGSPRLMEMLAPQLAGLSPEERSALETLSLARSLPLSVACGLAPLQVWEDLENRMLLNVSESSSVLCVDQLTSHILVAQLPVLRRRRLLGLLVEALLTDEDARNQAEVQLVAWRHELGERLPEQLLLEAARKAWWKSDWRAAQALAEGAWVRHGTVAAGLLFAKVLMHIGDRAAAEAILGKVAERAQPSEEIEVHRILGRAQLVRGASSSPGQQVIESVAFRHPQSSLGLSDSGSGSVPTTIDGAVASMMGGHPKASWDIARPLLESDDPEQVAMAGSAALVALLSMGRPLDCLELTPRLRWAQEQMQGTDVLHYDALNLDVLAAYARGIIGDPEAAIRELRAAIRNAAATCNNALANKASVMLARLLLDKGKVSEAHWLFSACADNESLLMVRQAACGGALFTALLLGDALLIESAAVRLAACPQTDARGVEIDLASAALEMHRGRIGSAVSILEEAAVAARRGGAYAELADIVHLLARMDRADAAIQFCDTQADEVQGTVNCARFAFVRAAATGDAQAVAMCAEEFTTAGSSLYAAEAWAVASRMFRRAGDPRLASAAARRCIDARKGFDGVPTLLLQIVEDGLPLSRREREIAMQVAGGSSNKEIADRLVISVRTVDNHLYRIYRKLGVANRRALRAMVQPSRDH